MSQTNRLREGLTDNRDYDARGNLVCERCKNTGYYGDTEPGIHGNDEVVACECGNKTLCSIGAHVATDYGWIMWCDKCNLQADMSVARKHRVPPPGTPRPNVDAARYPPRRDSQRPAIGCIQLLVHNCARCGNDHNVTFEPLMIPAEEWTHWGFCPATVQPLMMRIVNT